MLSSYGKDPSALQTIVVCQGIVGANENSSSSMYVMPSHANNHVHYFFTLLAGTYHVVGSCHLLVLTFNIFDASKIPTSPSKSKAFDKALLFFMSPLGTWSCKSPSQSHVPPPPLLVVPTIDSVYRVIKILSLVEMLKETQAQSNTKFIKDMDCNILPL